MWYISYNYPHLSEEEVAAEWLAHDDIVNKRKISIEN